MPGINNAAVGDDYSSAARILDVWTSTGGWFAVSGASVYLQIQYGVRGTDLLSDEQLIGDGGFGYLPAGATGIQFRNAVKGKTARVTAYIGSGGPVPDPQPSYPEPTLTISALGTVSVTGTHPTQQQFSGNGVYTPPAGVTGIRVRLWGGGGQGGGAVATGAGQAAAGTGGGGGGYSEAMFAIADLPGVIQIAIGAGGANGAAGQNGQDGALTAFGSTGTSLTLLEAFGGKGGVASAVIAAFPTGGQGGGLGGGGTFQGQAGGPLLALAVNAILGGAGGDSGEGGGGGQALFGSTGGQVGQSAGAGGSGAANTASQAARAGAAGANGLCIIDEFYD